MILPSPQRTVRPVVFRPTAKPFPRFFFAPRSVKRDRSPHLAHPLPLFPHPFLLFCGIHRHFILSDRRFYSISARRLSTSPHFARICFHEFARFSPRSRPVSTFFSGVSFPSVPPLSRFLRFCRLLWDFSPTSALSVLVLALDPAYYSPLRSTCQSPLSHPAPQDHLFLEKHFTFEKRCAILHKHLNKHLPVAQLDSASDSDSEGRRFESCRVGQTRAPPTQGGGALVCSTAPARICGNFVACDGIA